MISPQLAIAIKQAAATYKVSGLILCAVAMTESSGGKNVYNPEEEAHGPFQIKLTTAKEYEADATIFALYDDSGASRLAAKRLKFCSARNWTITGQIKCLNSEHWRSVSKVRNNMRTQRRVTFSEHTKKVLSHMVECQSIEE